MGPTAFRDGIFSESDPMSKYGALLTSYSDGTLGRAPFARRGRGTAGLGSIAAVGSCQQLCVDVNRMYGTPERIKRCNRLCARYPRKMTKLLTRRYRARVAKRTKATSGLGELDSTTMTAAGIGVVLVAGLLWMGSSKKRR